MGAASSPIKSIAFDPTRWPTEDYRDGKKPSFAASLQRTLVSERSKGSGTPTFIRATTKTIKDHEGRIVTALSGEATFRGRRVHNLITASEDMTNGAYTAGLGAVVDSATQATFDGTANGNVSQLVGITDDNSGAGGRTFVFSAYLNLVSGTISSNDAVQIRIEGTAITTSAISVGDNLSGSETVRVSATASTDAAGTLVNCRFFVDDAITLSITKWQLEEVTGQLNQNPSEYVSSGVGTGAELNTDANALNPASDANATTGWSTTGLDGGNDLTVTATETNNSDYAFFIDGQTNPSSANRVTKDLKTGFGLVEGQTYVIEFDWKHTGTGGDWTFYLSATEDARTTAAATITATDTTYSSVRIPFVLDSTSNDFGVWRENNAGNNGQIYVDNFSIKLADHGANRDAVKWFTTHNGNTVSSGVVTEAQGPAINSANSQWVELDGVSGTYVSTPDVAGNTPSGSITVIGYVAPNDWTPAADGVVGGVYSFSSSQISYVLFLDSAPTAGRLGFFFSTTGSLQSGNNTVCDTTLSFADGTGHWVRATYDSVGLTVKFYTSDQPIGTAQSALSWTQVGSTESVTGGDVFNSTEPFTVGAISSGTVSMFNGKIGRVMAINSTDPTAAPFRDYNANDHVAGVTQTSSTTGEVWTYQGGAKVFGPYSRWIDVDGSSDGWTSPDTAAASITSDIFLAGWGAADDWTPAANAYIAGKWFGTGNNKAYGLAIGTTGFIRFITASDGATLVASESTAAPTWTDGTLHGFAVAWDDSADTANFYTTEDPPWTPPHLVRWTLLGDPDVAHVCAGIADTAALVTIGGIYDNLSVNEWTGRIMRAYAIASTDPTVAPAWDFDARNLTPGVTTGTMATGEVWTAVGNGTIESNIPAPFDADGPKGINIEGARTNLLTYSQDFSTDWGNSNSVDTQNYAIAPDGTKTANRVVDDSATGTGNVGVSQDVTVSSGTSTYTIHVKADQLSLCAVTTQLFDAGATGTSYFNLTTGEWETQDVNHTIHPPEYLGGGWYRIGVSFSTSTDLVGRVNVWAVEADGVLTCDLDGTSSILAWGAQVEAGAFPSSYIPTTTTSATRNADVLTYSATGQADTFPMTMHVEYTMGLNRAASGSVFGISDNSASDRVTLSVNASTLGTLFVNKATNSQALINAADTPNSGVTYALTGVVATNDFELYQDGKTTGTPDTSGSVPTGMLDINIGSRYDETLQPYGDIRNARVYKRRLNDDQVAAL